MMRVPTCAICHVISGWSLSRRVNAKAAPFNVLMVHGSPRKVNQYLFADFPEKSLLRMMAEQNADVMLFGHTHKPYHKAIPYTV